MCVCACVYVYNIYRFALKDFTNIINLKIEYIYIYIF